MAAGGAAVRSGKSCGDEIKYLDCGGSSMKLQVWKVSQGYTHVSVSAFITDENLSKLFELHQFQFFWY